MGGGVGRVPRPPGPPGHWFGLSPGVRFDPDIQTHRDDARLAERSGRSTRRDPEMVLDTIGAGAAKAGVSRVLPADSAAGAPATSAG